MMKNGGGGVKSNTGSSSLNNNSSSHHQDDVDNDDRKDGVVFASSANKSKTTTTTTMATKSTPKTVRSGGVGVSTTTITNAASFENKKKNGYNHNHNNNNSHNNNGQRRNGFSSLSSSSKAKMMTMKVKNVVAVSNNNNNRFGSKTAIVDFGVGGGGNNNNNNNTTNTTITSGAAFVPTTDKNGKRSSKSSSTSTFSTTRFVFMLLVVGSIAATSHLLHTFNHHHEDFRAASHSNFFMPQQLEKVVEKKKKKKKSSRTSNESILPKHNNISSSNLLTYGVELSYILPMTLLDQINEEINATYHKRNVTYHYFKNRTITIPRGGNDMITKLKSKGIIAGFYGNRVRGHPNAWTMAVERGGFELASNINPSISDIRTLQETFLEEEYQIDPDIHAMHINIDAIGRTSQEIANVYKNFIALQQAINVIHTSSRVMASGYALSVGKQYPTVQDAYHAIDTNWEELPYPAYNYRQNPIDGTLKHVPVKRSILCLRMSERTNTTRSFEFRGMQPSTNTNVLLNWLQFASKFVSSSYNGIVVTPIERTLEQQWKTLFEELIQDPNLERQLLQWRYEMHNSSSSTTTNREEIITKICPYISKPMCTNAQRGIKKRIRHEKQKRRWENPKSYNATAEELLNPKRASRKKIVQEMYHNHNKNRRTNTKRKREEQ